MIGTVNAQQTKDVNVNAVVYAQMVITKINDLEFGGIGQSQEKTVDPNETNAGVVKINGPSSIGVDVSFSLPLNLSNGGRTLPVSFGNTSGGWNNENVPSGITHFDLNNGVTNIELDATSGNLFIYLGGTLNSSNPQQAGSYTSTIIVSVNYN